MSDRDVLMKIWWSVWFFGLFDSAMLAVLIRQN